MGIASLLPNLKSITRKAHVSQYAGQTAAVDAYCLLHRGAHACARELVEGEPTDRHVVYCMSRIDLLVRAGVRPYVVFDGDRLPAKAEEERSRERSREEAKAKARALWQQGNKTAAFECYQRAVDITPAVANGFVDALRRRGIQFIVAPFEADAQMAYLALNGSVDVVVTEDSDLLTYGCPTVFFKMDKGGEGEEVQLRDLPQTRELGLANMTHELFQEMCVMAGCDFCNSLPGVGMKKAHQQIKRTRCFHKAVRALRFSGTPIPDDYLLRFQRALWTFRHQRVFCPRRRALVTLKEIPEGGLSRDARVPAAAELAPGEADFLGPVIRDEVAAAIAAGDLDPISKVPFTSALPQDGPQGQPEAASSSQPARHGGSTLQQQQLNPGSLAAAAAAAAASKPFKAPRQVAGVVADSEGSRPGSSQGADAEKEEQQKGPSGRAAALPSLHVGGLRAPSGRAAPSVGAARKPAVVQAAACRVPGLKQQKRLAQSGPAISRYFQPHRQQQEEEQRHAGPKQPGAEGVAGSLLAVLQAAVQQPSLDDVFEAERQGQLSRQGTEDAGGMGEEEGVPLLPSTRQQPLTPADLLPQRTETLDELFEEHRQRQAVASASAGAVLPLAQLWAPQRAQGPSGGGEGPSPFGLGLGPDHGSAGALGVTPGFYRAGHSEEEEGEGEEEGLLDLLPAGEAAGSSAASIAAMDAQQRQQVRQEVRRLRLPLTSGAEVEEQEDGRGQQAVQASEQQQREGGTPLPGGGGGGGGGDPISSLAHLPAYAAEAEEVVCRALAAACEGALACRLPTLAQPTLLPSTGARPPLEGGSTAKRARLTATSPTCRIALRGNENENPMTNPFTKFALAKN